MRGSSRVYMRYGCADDASVFTIVTRTLGLCACFVDCCLSFFLWPLCCLPFFDLRILITCLVSSNSSWRSDILITCLVSSISSWRSGSYCVACPSSTYGFWLPVWYLPTIYHTQGEQSNHYATDAVPIVMFVGISWIWYFINYVDFWEI
jgi:hypothetical protein